MNKQILAIDDGHYGIKITSDHGNYVLNALVAEGRHPRINSITGMAKEDELYLCDGHEYTILEGDAKNAGNKPIVATSTPHYLLSPANAVMIHHAIRNSGIKESNEVILCTSLPFNRFYTSDGLNKKLIDNKKLNLISRKVSSYGYEPISIQQQFVLSEGVAAYFDLLYNNDLSLNNEVSQIAKNSLITVVDVGGQTTDIVTLNDNNIDLSKSITKTGDYAGGLFLKRQVRGLLAKEMNCLEEHIQDSLIEKLITESELSDAGIGAKINVYKKQIAAYIANAIAEKVGNANDIGLVYFVGGGSLLLRNSLAEIFPSKSRFAENPVFANSQGMYKLMKLQIRNN